MELNLTKNEQKWCLEVLNGLQGVTTEILNDEQVYEIERGINNILSGSIYPNVNYSDRHNTHFVRIYIIDDGKEMEYHFEKEGNKKFKYIVNYA